MLRLSDTDVERGRAHDIRDALATIQRLTGILIRALEIEQEEQSGEVEFIDSPVHTILGEIRTATTSLSGDANGFLEYVGGKKAELEEALAAISIREGTAALVHATIERMGSQIQRIDQINKRRGTPSAELNIARHDLGDIINTSIDLAKAGGNCSGITFDTEIESGIIAEVDSCRIGRAITNLIKNAIEAINRAGKADGKIIVRLHRAPIQVRLQGAQSSSTKAMITVHDNGPGIPAEAKDDFWGTYHSSKGECDSGGKGQHGHGTKIVYQAVKVHEGHIMFKTEEGKGTTFTILLDALPPIREEECEDLKRYTVVIVDDNTGIREAMSSACKIIIGTKAQHTAANGRECMSIIGGIPADTPLMIILDLNLGEEEGIAVAQQINEKRPDACIVLSTGNDGGVVNARLEEAGVDKSILSGVLQKPFDIDVLKQTLVQAVRY